MPRTLYVGSQGVEVLHLQGLLNARPPTALPFLQTDGIFGPKTQARVREFQQDYGLAADGIVGPLTWAELERTPALPEPATGFPTCGTCIAQNQFLWPAAVLHQLAQQVLANLSAFGAMGSTSAAPSASLPTTIRSLTPPEIATLSGTFGTSINYSFVLVSDALGLNGRAFTVASATSPAIQVINWGPSPPTNTMIHEMAHVWQSQHHTQPTAFMACAVANQAAAAAAQAAASALGLTTKFSAYGYVPGRPFAGYGAEQIAQQVENGETPIISHVKAMAPLLPSASNVLSLGNNTAFEDLLKPGVKI